MFLCTVFGEDEFNESIRHTLRKTMINLIENHSVDLFYVGEEGQFNRMVIEELKELVKLYPHIYYEIIICNVPYKEYTLAEKLFGNFMIINAEKEESREHALTVVKDWMVWASDCVIIYTRNTDAEIQRIKESAEKQEKIIIEI